MHTREEKLQAFGRILDVLDELREKCPWDRKQTNESLRPQTLEEVYELSDAILKGEEHELSKELGDVLLHVIFYAKIGEEKQHFDIVDVINFLCDKLIYRHPHVFSTAEVGSAEDVKRIPERCSLGIGGGLRECGNDCRRLGTSDGGSADRLPSFEGTTAGTVPPTCFGGTFRPAPGSFGTNGH